MSYLYGLRPEHRSELNSIFRAYPELERVILYGSRATGRYHERSDIDLATLGLKDRFTIGQLFLELEESNLPYTCDLRAYEALKYLALKKHIDTHGIVIYNKLQG